MLEVTVRIIGVGGYLPENVVSNFDLEKIVDTSDDWITKRTGIRNRHIATEDETTSYLAVKAVQDALHNCNVSANEIDMMICATTTPDLTFPSTACLIQKKLNINKPIIAFDIQAVCSGFIYALSIANDMMKCRTIKKAVVIGADKMSSIIDWSDRATCVLFGDGAGAVVLQADVESEKYDNEMHNFFDKSSMQINGAKTRSETNIAKEKLSKIIDSRIYANGNFSEILYTSGGVSTKYETLHNLPNTRDIYGNYILKTSGTIKMDGQNVFKHAVAKMIDSIKEIVSINGYDISDIDLIIPHQANQRILSHVAEKLDIDINKFVLTIADHANTSSASIPLALNSAIKAGRAKKGDLLILEALGSGLTWGSVILRL